MRKIYIAGALNSDACGYIQNLHRMVKFGEEIRQLGTAVYIPGNDFLLGLITGTHDYKDYFENSIEWLLICNAVAVTPGWEQSKGTMREIQLAKKEGIPVFYSVEDVHKFLKENED